MSDDPLSNPLAELGHISLHAQQLSQSTGRLAAGAEQGLREGLERDVPAVGR
jgi:hypothetical protein